MLARIGTSTAARIACELARGRASPRGRSRRRRRRRAPWRGLIAASSPSTARMSVRAMIRKFGSRRASTAARMRLMAVSRSTTFLPSRWPQRFGLTWSSMWQPARPASSSSWTVRATFIGSPKPVSASTIAGRSVIRAICPAAGGDLGEGGQADVGQAEVGGQHGAGDVDAVEALLLDEPRRERVERAGELQRGRRRRGARGSGRASAPG